MTGKLTIDFGNGDVTHYPAPKLRSITVDDLVVWKQGDALVTLRAVLERLEANRDHA